MTTYRPGLLFTVKRCNQAVLEDTNHQTTGVRQPAPGGHHATLPSPRRCLVLYQKSIKPLTAQKYPAATGIT